MCMKNYLRHLERNLHAAFRHILHGFIPGLFDLIPVKF